MLDTPHAGADTTTAGRDTALEAALCQLPGIRDAFAPRPATGLAYLVPGGAAPRLDDVLALLDAPVDGVRPAPRRVVFVDAVPLHADGTPDVTRLPARDDARGECGGIQALPAQDARERQVAAAWEDILGEPVGRFDDFRNVDGFSLMAAQVAGRLSAALGHEVPVRRLYEALAVWHLAASLGAPAAAGVAAPPAPSLATPGTDEAFQLSPFQLRLWTADRLAPQAAAYHIPVAWRLQGALDVEALRAALRELQCRHEALRLRIEEAGSTVLQRVLPADADAGLAAFEIRATAAADVDAAIADQARLPFALEREAPARTCLLRVAPHEHVLLFTVHHVAADGWTIGLLARDLGALFAAARAGAPFPPCAQAMPLRELVVQEQRRVAASAASNAFWSERFATPLPPLALPADHPAAAQHSQAGNSVAFEVPAALAQAVRVFAARRHATPFAVFASALFALLARLGGQRDLRLGYPIARRDGGARENTAGCLVNTLALSVSLAPCEAFDPLLARVGGQLLAATEHPDVLLERLPGGAAGAAPFEVLLNLNEHDQPLLALDGLQVQTLERRSPGSPYALTWILSPRGTSFAGRLEYDSERFEPATVHRLVGLWRTLLASALAEPQRPLEALDWLAADERRALLALGDGGPAPAAFAPRAHRAVAHWARATPEACSVRCDVHALTYRALDDAAARLAQRLHAEGVAPGERVAVCVARGLALPIALLAIQRVGATYLPLDPQAPDARLAHMLADARPRWVLVDAANAARAQAPDVPAPLCLDPFVAQALDAAAPAMAAPRPDVDVAADVAAYCLYTSGSTGAPKGVLVSYGALAEHVRAVARAFAVESADCVLQFASNAFDVSIEQWMVAWSAGARVLMREDAPWSADELFERVRTHGVTVADMPLAYWQMLASRPDSQAIVTSLRLIVVGGEAVVAAPGFEPAPGFPHALNAYGPTETTITCTLGDLLAARGGAGPYVPIGRPLPGTRLYLLDDRLQPVPRGAAGEIFIAGSRVALGYLGRPALTAERFPPCPFGAPGERMYRSGDQGRWLADGRLEFLGRRDLQVKIGGVRIELGEIEQVLMGHPDVRAAAALLAGAADAPHVVACIVMHDGSGDLRDLPSFARLQLAATLRPAVWQALPALPLTAQGKIDRVALARTIAVPAPKAASAAPTSADAPAHPPTLARLLCLLAAIAPAPVRDPDAPLVEAGLHSLLMLRLVTHCLDVFGVPLKPRELLKAGTARAIAALIDQLLPEGTSA